MCPSLVTYTVCRTVPAGKREESSMSNIAPILDKLAVRETIEDYLHFLDTEHWDGVAACFVADARSHYNFEPEVLIGGSGVVKWLRTRLASFSGTEHALSNLHIEIDGDRATCESRVSASLLHEAHGERRLAVRAIRYRDELRREGDRWRICERRHEPMWQYDLPAQVPKL